MKNWFRTKNLEKRTAEVDESEKVYKVPFNDPAQVEDFDYDYPDNYIRTTKYTLLTFLPVNLFNQFRRFYNIYFLLAAIFAFIPNASSLSPVTQVMPLVFVLFVTALKDAIEDYGRYKTDKQANSYPCKILRDGKMVDVKCQDLVAGDIIYTKKGERFPCDMIVLSTSFDDGTCFIETSQLDGENNLKRRSALASTMEATTPEALSKFRGRVECEMPNNRLNHFQGRLILNSTEGQENQFPLTINQMLLRGAELRNTEHVYGLCVYAGVDTKVFRNLQISKLKFSSLDGRLNRLLIIMFIYNAVILVVSALLGARWAFANLDPGQAWYIFYPFQTAAAVAGLQIMTYYILYTYTIPISLFVSLEIVRAIQAIFIGWDEKLAFENSQSRLVSTSVKNSNLNEELGNVDYIFSDKTGTLTQNVMRLSKWYIGGMLFDESASPKSILKTLRGDNSKLSPEEKKDLELFVRHVAICHTAIPNFTEESDEFTYEAESPDEAALLLNMKENDIIVTERGKKNIKISILGKNESYELLELIEFSSDRKRMSVILNIPNEGIVLFCKGADSIIFERLSEESGKSTFKKEVEQKLIQFSNLGLRTLCYAYCVLTKEQFDSFKAAYSEASASLTNREEKMNEAATMIEKNLTLLGCSAIEDKLQDEVPETIEYLLKCGIKLWVLTGDKRETAIKIAISCRLFSTGMNVMMLEIDNKEEAKSKLEELYQKVQQNNNDDKNALVVTGECLRFALENAPDEFLKVGRRCHAVLCCRVTPLQKAQVVKLVKKKEKKITLSVGDGANDVSMIQSANIGVGIAGMEGGQAVRAADYAIGQFRCLKRLIAFHGRYCNFRQKKMIYYCLYKNLFFITICFWFGLASGWGGLQIYQEDFLAMFNVIFTSLFPISLGIFERDLKEDMIEAYPESYRQASKMSFYRWQTLVYYLLFGLAQSAIVYFSLVALIGDGILVSSSFVMDYWMQAWFASTIVMMVVSGKFLLNIRQWDVINLGMVGLSIFVYIAFMYLAAIMGLVAEIGAAANVSVTPSYYIFAIGIAITALLPDFVSLYFNTTTFPMDDDILREECTYSPQKAENRGKKPVLSSGPEAPEPENSVALKRWYKRNRPDLSEDQKKDTDDTDSRMEQETASNDAPNFVTDEDYRIPPFSFASDGSDVIVIHPGSLNIRLAKASDSIPRTAPHFICRRMKAKSSDIVGGTLEGLRAKVDSYADEMEPIVDAMAREAKLRLLPNSGSTVISFNSLNKEPTKIEEHNDPARIEWIQDDGGQNYYVGEDALRVDLVQNSDFELFQPIKNGTINTLQYKSIEQFKTDLLQIWSHLISKDLFIDLKDLKSYKVLLVIGNLAEKVLIESMLDVLIRDMKFEAVSVHQESIVSCFGAGITVGCVVDVGAEKTSISCVEDGLLIPETRIDLNIGGSDITRLFGLLMTQRAGFANSEFSNGLFSTSNLYIFSMFQRLKESFGTFRISDIAVQNGECYLRQPGQKTLMYNFKTFYEPLLSVYSMFNPEFSLQALKEIEPHDDQSTSLLLLHSDGVMKTKFGTSAIPFHIPEPENIGDKRTTLYKEPLKMVYNPNKESKALNDDDVKDNVPTEPETKAEPEKITEQDPKAMLSIETGMIPLQTAIVLSILSTSPKLQSALKNKGNNSNVDNKIQLSSSEEERIVKMFSSILLTGGGLCHFPGVSPALREKVTAAFEQLKETFGFSGSNTSVDVSLCDVILSPRDLEGEILAWKGASILVRLDGYMNPNSWMRAGEWEEFGYEELCARIFGLPQ